MDSFSRGDHTVIWGDAIEALRSRVPDQSVDLVFCDHPYNIHETPAFRTCQPTGS